MPSTWQHRVTIHVAQGTYYPDLDGGFNAPAHVLGSRTETFSMKSDVTMLGGYIGYNDASPNTRDPDLYPTILSGEIGTTSVATDNSYHVVSANGVNTGAILDGFTIRDGYGASQTVSSQRKGAGIYITGVDSSPQVLNCIIRDNVVTGTGSAGGHGAGVYADFLGNLASTVFDNCRFESNSARTAGGAAYVYRSGTIQFSGCTFVQNTVADTASALGGGAIFSGTDSNLQTLRVIECAFLQNTSAGELGGGAICHYPGFGRLELRKTTFLQNETSDGPGGGVYVLTKDSVKIVACTFDRNKSVHVDAGQVGGGGVAIFEAGLGLKIINCEFIANESTNDSLGGGAFF
jgi:hypothetical protein